MSFVKKMDATGVNLKWIKLVSDKYHTSPLIGGHEILDIYNYLCTYDMKEVKLSV